MKTNSFISTLWRYVQFALSTLAGTGVDLLVVWICAHYLFNGQWFVYHNYQWGEYVLSPFISFECAVLTNYVIAYFYVWKDRIEQRSSSDFWHRYISYNLTSTGTFLFKMVILLLIKYISEQLGDKAWDVTWCNLAAICVSGLMNFAFQELLVFGKKEKNNT